MNFPISHAHATYQASPAAYVPMPLVNTIRVETAFRYPIHQLDKSKIGTSIEISKESPQGNKEYWRVKHTPGPLSYQVDSLVINRRLDEYGWDKIPQLLPIGSLSSICRMLNRSDSGTSRKDIREALEKNAGALITADFQYQLKSKEKGRNKTALANFRGTFSRYAVYFTGMTLPNGHSADCTYVHFNHLYYQALKNATLRPLDYDYLKALKVSAQKFYEIVSYRIFAALKQRRDSAWISYSDYCLFSNQKRYFRRSQMIAQMNRLQQPHVESGYLAQFATYIDSFDNLGQKDWKIILVPGAKSRDEFHFFTKKRLPQPSSGFSLGQVEAGPEGAQSLVAALVSIGIPETKAKPLLELFPGEVHRLLSKSRESTSMSIAKENAIDVTDSHVRAAPREKSFDPQDLLLRYRREFANLGIRVTKRVREALNGADEQSVRDAFAYVEEYQKGHNVRSKAGLFVMALEQGWKAEAGAEVKAHKPEPKKSAEDEREAFFNFFNQLPKETRNKMTREALEALPARYQALLSRVTSEELKKQSVESAVFDFWKDRNY